jgi:hypothetical protein
VLLTYCPKMIDMIPSEGGRDVCRIVLYFSDFSTNSRVQIIISNHLNV